MYRCYQKHSTTWVASTRRMFHSFRQGSGRFYFDNPHTHTCTHASRQRCHGQWVFNIHSRKCSVDRRLVFNFRTRYNHKDFNVLYVEGEENLLDYIFSFIVSILARPAITYIYLASALLSK